MNKKTTIAISSKHDIVLNQLVVKYDTNKKQFLEKSIEYFNKYDINPFEEFKLPKDEMTKVVKKLDQVIAFIRVQERDILKPACTSMVIYSKSIDNKLQSLDNLVTPNSVQTEVLALTKRLNDRLNIIAKESSESDAKQFKALILFAQLLEKDKGKNIQEYLQRLFNPK